MSDLFDYYSDDDDDDIAGGGSYNKAALKGFGSYNKAALKGFGSYNKAALKGCGSYNKAALKGFGKTNRLVKGSAEAKAHMAYLRSLRGKRKTRGGAYLRKSKSPYDRLFSNYVSSRVPSSTFARARAAYDGLEGSGPLLDFYKNSLGKWSSRIFSDKAKDEARLAELRKAVAAKKAGKTSGGKIEGRDVVDFFAGPLGWIAMGKRKKRQREIADLEKQLQS